MMAVKSCISISNLTSRQGRGRHFVYDLYLLITGFSQFLQFLQLLHAALAAAAAAAAAAPVRFPFGSCFTRYAAYPRELYVEDNHSWKRNIASAYSYSDSRRLLCVRRATETRGSSPRSSAGTGATRHRGLLRPV